MRIGYACLTIGVPETNLKNCTLKNASKENLTSIIGHNLRSLENIIEYNIANDIKLFRISSDIIPFGSSPVNEVKWWEVFSTELENIGNKIKEAKIRVSMHPGQYTVLNSPKKDVVKRAVEDLEYHNKFLDSLNVDSRNKIILHVGGVYGDKESAVESFAENYNRLSKEIKKRLVIENDDKSYNVKDVLNIGKALGIPVVYDNLHNEVLPYDESKDHSYWIGKCGETWMEEDGVQKIHYSQQDPDKRAGSHSKTMGLEEFVDFTCHIKGNVDVMLEIKDKNLSTIKAINYFKNTRSIETLEIQWSKYKYNILEHSPKDYNGIRNLLMEKDEYPVLEFYSLIDSALENPVEMGNSINTAQHVWGYFKSLATNKEADKFKRYLERYERGTLSIKAIKNFLWEMTVKYNDEYLLNSYYFYF